MDRRFGGGPSGDDRVQKNGDVGGCRVGVGRLTVEWQVVVVLNGLKGEALSEETEMVNGDRRREEVIDR